MVSQGGSGYYPKSIQGIVIVFGCLQELDGKFLLLSTHTFQLQNQYQNYQPDSDLEASNLMAS